MSLISKLFAKWFNPDFDPVSFYNSELAQINAFGEDLHKKTDEEIRSEITEFKKSLLELDNEEAVFRHLKEIRPRVYAIVREASTRTIRKTHFDVQILGGLALADGSIAEMRTGEGKTLTATLPLVLFALAGKGAHLVTVNDYLARWHASQNGPIFEFLGLSVSSIQHEQSFRYDPSYHPEEEEIAKLESEVEGLVMDVKHMRPISRREAYAADITYGTNNEYGFDYLRDNMAVRSSALVQRTLFYAIIDEVDSILIDEARTPLIISAPDTEPTTKYVEFAKLVNRLSSESHYEVDEKKKAAVLTDAGITKVEELLGVKNLYETGQGVSTLHHIEQALRARTLYHKDKEYVIRDGEIVIVDEFTGRMMFGRRYSEGLHQAIEAKEGVRIQQESKTLATITFQNLFRLYSKLAGMTGTAKTEEEEFFKIYALNVVTIPTHRPMIRVDLPDMVYKTERAKFEAIADEVSKRHSRNQPILIGTASIAKNELLADILKNKGLRFELLNAKQHEREALIIAQAGRPGAITVATNIAGRGVDILLGGNPPDKDESRRVLDSGGLHVIGTERHESRRIDNQLRGRSGRQGDPGSSQFFVSMEDDLMRLFGGERMKNLMNTLGLPDDQPIEHKLVSRSIEQAQKRIEGLNFDTRKHVLEFDDVLNHQRETIYSRRRVYLEADQKPEVLEVEVLKLITEELENLVRPVVMLGDGVDKSVELLAEKVNTIFPVSPEFKERMKIAFENSGDLSIGLLEELEEEARVYWEKKREELTEPVFRDVQKGLLLQSLDALWMEHLDTMDHLRDSVRLRGYGQRDPLVEYKKEGHRLFRDLLGEIRRQVVYAIYKIGLAIEQAPRPQQFVISSSSGANVESSDGTDSAGVGRNDPCPCGSGKKYKKCGLINTSEHQQNMAKLGR